MTSSTSTIGYQDIAEMSIINAFIHPFFSPSLTNSNFKQVNDDPEFAKTFLDWLFERYLGRSKKSYSPILSESPVDRDIASDYTSQCK